MDISNHKLQQMRKCYQIQQSFFFFNVVGGGDMMEDSNRRYLRFLILDKPAPKAFFFPLNYHYKDQN